jgi:hypothetical protein
MLFLHGLGVFFGTQVHRAKRIALALVAVDLGLQRFGVGNAVGVGGKAFQQLRGRQTRLLSDALGRLHHRVACRFGQRLGAGAGLARLGSRAFGVAFRLHCIAQAALARAQGIGGSGASAPRRA